MASERHKIRVPLGDPAHSDEEKNTTKIVRRKLTELKGKAGSRTGIVYWRGRYHKTKEDADGFFDCVEIVAAPEDGHMPVDQTRYSEKANGNGNGKKKASAKKTSSKKAPAKKATAKKATAKTKRATKSKNGNGGSARQATG